MTESLESLKQQARGAVDRLAADLVGLSRDLHAHPEVRFEEVHASETIAALLAREGFEVERGTGGLPTALKAEMRGTDAGPMVAILAEYDALPKIGHACGHNLIAAAGVGAFLSLKGAVRRGTVRLLGTPGEEGGGGKVHMLRAGAFSGVDAVMMVHADGETRPWLDCAGRVALSVVFHGRSSHAASAPDEGVNALDAALLLFNGINALRQKMRDGARVHGIIAEGGEVPNIIPARTRVELYVRAFEPQYLERLVQEVRACAEGAAVATGCTVEVSLPSPAYESLVTNPPLVEAFARNLDALGHAWVPGRRQTHASTDLGNVGRVIPSIHPYLGLGAGLDPHTVEFAAAAGGPPGERVVLDGARALAMTALDVLETPALLDEARRVFAEQQ